ncbi:uncharacterized protein SOCEGT47_073160 [Sorangium cellulosum]|uniref:Secreted protein n=1 Tax=Sorangium cellulosum TaxID=56 RepID=A0A4P2QBR4_SORCE|nr:hypothetical protein [Sorangium cellulosum]AUX26746.1 uncharacterized protein SOCEGT47_073160 [Sorangium cellulosum]
MSRSLILILVSSLAVAAAACQSSQQQPAGAPVTAPPEGARAGATPDPAPADDDICADQQPTGDPPECPSGCVWDEAKQRCTQLRGVIVDQRPDGRFPTEPPATSPTTPAPAN